MRPLFLLLALMAWLPALSAHDFWILPKTFTPPVGKAVVLRMFVGDGFDEDGEKPFDKKATLKFVHISPSSRVDLTKGEITPVEAGLHTVILERDARLISLAARKFTEYLKEESLDTILADREKRGETRSPGRERYWRSLKVILRAGGKGGTPGKPFGQKLELVPLADPTALKAGDSLELRLLFAGKPLAGATVSALWRDADKVVRHRAVTDAKGKVVFRLDKAGTWLVRTVHMRRAVEDKASGRR
jgi:uncharacterized GH25 family protein